MSDKAWRFVGCCLLMALPAGCMPTSSGTPNNYGAPGREIGMKFDPQRWADQAAVYASPFPRGQMVSDLRRTQLKTGATRAEVISLLGAPTETDKFTDHDLVYWLGPEEGAISVDSQWLLIDLDAAGRVRTVAVATD